ncbi:hypothetical protein F0919_11045 [Taibaiella lutea]|uniref:Uncharacterized protein n=1 Tax=Taibaiella lutea TaxID=2608001 RepID=A0A5M6CIS9_9BACT|nr:hypothetical protein [Taibaiella lutea]KAA5535118.1 hypothetical protein F0919_11045 [Taibaiella lutea]
MIFKTTNTLGSTSSLNDILSFNDEVIPERRRGRYSKKNLDGYKITHKDRPKVLKSIYMGEKPIFGDWSKGSFSQYSQRMVYPTTEFPPQELSIKAQYLGPVNDADTEGYNVRFFVDDLLDVNDALFEYRLLFLLNLLQENVFGADVFSSDASASDFLSSLVVDWEIFPPGTRDSDLNRIIGGLRSVTPEVIATITARYDFITSLNPTDLILGSSGMRRYFGAKFDENLVAFENMTYGNALYILFEDWTTLSQFSRTEVLNRPSDQYVRIKHQGAWHDKVRHIIQNKLSRNL